MLNYLSHTYVQKHFGAQLLKIKNQRFINSSSTLQSICGYRVNFNMASKLLNALNDVIMVLSFFLCRTLAINNRLYEPCFYLQLKNEEQAIITIRLAAGIYFLGYLLHNFS